MLHATNGFGVLVLYHGLPEAHATTTIFSEFLMVLKCVAGIRRRDTLCSALRFI